MIDTGLSSLSLKDQEFFITRAEMTIGERFPLVIEIEAGTVAGNIAVANEDAFAIKRFGSALGLALFDGATSLKKIPAHEKLAASGARFASHFLRDRFLAREEWSDSLLSELNYELGAAISTFEGLDVNDPLTRPSSTATLVLLNPDNNIVHLQHVGDSFAAAQYRDQELEVITPDPFSEFEEQLMEKMRTLAQRESLTNRDARNLTELQQHLIQTLSKFLNHPSGNCAGVANGDSQMDQYIVSKSIPLSSIKTLLIGSDGLPPPQYPISFKKNLRRLMINLLQLGFPASIREKKLLEDSDPEWKIARYKHSDDATGILISFGLVD